MSLLKQYIKNNSVEGRLNCRFVVLVVSNCSAVLPCGCGMLDEDGETKILHYGNFLYCCGGKNVTHPGQCHAKIELGEIHYPVAQTFPIWKSELCH